MISGKDDQLLLPSSSKLKVFKITNPPNETINFCLRFFCSPRVFGRTCASRQLYVDDHHYVVLQLGGSAFHRSDPTGGFFQRTAPSIDQDGRFCSLAKSEVLQELYEHLTGQFLSFDIILWGQCQNVPCL